MLSGLFLRTQSDAHDEERTITFRTCLYLCFCPELSLCLAWCTCQFRSQGLGVRSFFSHLLRSMSNKSKSIIFRCFLSVSNLAKKTLGLKIAANPNLILAFILNILLTLEVIPLKNNLALLLPKKKKTVRKNIIYLRNPPLCVWSVGLAKVSILSDGVSKY